MKNIWDLLVLAVKWFFRRKRLYRITGVASVYYLYLELNAAKIPIEAEPNYAEIGDKYGEFIKSVYGWIIDRFGGGVNWLGVAIALVLLILCILIEFNVIKPQKIVNAKNVFSGWFQKNTINYYNDNE